MGGGWCEEPAPGGAPNAEPICPQGFWTLRGDGGKWGWGWRTESPRGRLKEDEIQVGSDMDMMGPCIFTPVEMPEKHKAKSTLGVLPAPK